MPLVQERAEFRSAHVKKGTITYDFHISLEPGTQINKLQTSIFLIFNQIKIIRINEILNHLL